MIHVTIVALVVLATTALADLVDMKNGIVMPQSRLGLVSHPYYPIWADFKNTHRKSYLTIQEELARFTTFLEHHQQIDLHNRQFDIGNKSYQLAMNQFGDLTTEEFRAKVNGFKGDMAKVSKQRRFGSALRPNLTSALPDSVDWREKGYVTRVKDQGNCGSCWSFSTAGALEGQYFKKTGKLVDLSEQNLVDCDRGNYGCDGGLMDTAFDFVKAHGIEDYKSYPYRARRGRCRAEDNNAVTKDQGYVDLPEGDEEALEAAIAQIGPIAVAIDASHFGFRFYRNGVYDDHRCSHDLDHAVLAVGYGADSGQKYYIVKNSWSEDWGENGYVRMSRRKDNQCGIADVASYPLV